MTIQDLIDRQIFTLITAGSDTHRELTTPFCCDLLSIAMGRAPEGCAWVTVMANINTLAVASLTDAGCIILAEDVALDEATKAKAVTEGITVLATELPEFDAALSLWRLMTAGDESATTKAHT